MVLLHTVGARSGEPRINPLATFPEDAVPEGWAVIGSVTEAGPDGPTVTVDGAAYDGPTGWTHF